MREIYTEIYIDAPAERVWETIMEFEAYPDWNPCLLSVEGGKQVGERLAITMQLANGFKMPFRSTVVRAERNRAFGWRGGVPGIFMGEHVLIIEKLSNTEVKFINEERFTGLFAPLLLLFMEKPAIQSYEHMNRELKARVEQAVLVGRSTVESM